jgi:hypothetical protein
MTFLCQSPRQKAKGRLVVLEQVDPISGVRSEETLPHHKPNTCYTMMWDDPYCEESLSEVLNGGGCSREKMVPSINGKMDTHIHKTVKSDQYLRQHT